MMQFYLWLEGEKTARCHAFSLGVVHLAYPTHHDAAPPAFADEIPGASPMVRSSGLPRGITAESLVDAAQRPRYERRPVLQQAGMHLAARPRERVEAVEVEPAGNLNDDSAVLVSRHMGLRAKRARGL